MDPEKVETYKEIEIQKQNSGIHQTVEQLETGQLFRAHASIEEARKYIDNIKEKKK